MYVIFFFFFVGGCVCVYKVMMKNLGNICKYCCIDKACQSNYDIQVKLYKNSQLKPALYQHGSWAQMPISDIYLVHVC